MSKGCYFGEIEIIQKQRRAYSVIAAELSDTLTLTKQIYENVIAKEYPEIDAELRYTALLRSGRLKDAEIMIRERIAISKKPTSGKFY
jgi:CRP-like cAMP-binding protein